uniref:Carboxypeptidase n=1 Tax=Rhizochromulina marina TaxID=1034831 RepID=A0A7S2S5U4_9STRA
METPEMEGLLPGAVAAKEGRAWPRAKALVAGAVAAGALLVLALASGSGGARSTPEAEGHGGSGVLAAEPQVVRGDKPALTREWVQEQFQAMGMALSDTALDDAVLHMPGLSDDAPDIVQFSGYVEVSETKRSFYMLSLSQRSPKDDPLVLWTNGGPGCSGLLGYFTEHGPFRPMEDLSLRLNDYSWNKVANMLYIESPTGVGFSYSEGDVASDLLAGDESVARDNYELIQQVLLRHTALQDNDFYLSAESYGGHYIPTLAKQLVVGAAEATPWIKFKGFLVGNPYTDPVSNMKGMMGAFWGHQLVPAPVYKAWQEHCSDSKEVSTYYDDEYCVELEVEMMDAIGDLDWYGLDFPVCNRDLPDSGAFSEVLSAQAQQLVKYAYPRLHDKLVSRWQEKKKASLRRDLLGGRRLASSKQPTVYDACVPDYMTRYLNKAEVQDALHAEVGTTWAECSSSITYDFDSKMDYMEALYKHLLDDTSLRIMVYSGDDDSICAPLGTQDWIWKLGYSVQDDWAAWYYKDAMYGDGQVGGYRVRFTTPQAEEDSTSSRLSFVTIHHAGHEVPMYQPMRALHVFENFLDGVF